MPFDFAAAKLKARRVVHATLGVQAFYKADAISSPVEITARLHEAGTVYGDLLAQGYAETVEAVDRIVFVPSDSVIVLKRSGEVTFPHRAGVAFVLALKEVVDGPLEEVWQVTRK
jgi:hypothetical protein